MGHKGINHTGFDYVCGACQERCPYFVPDNITYVPICSKCWAKLNVVQRMMLVAEFKQADRLNTIANDLTSIMQSGEIFERRSRRDETN